MKILCVDDSAEHIEILHDIFESEGYTAVPCDNAFTALQFLQENRFDCIVCDLKMPILEGEHFLTIVKEKHPHVPVIILTGHIGNDDELLHKGAYAVLHKPPDIATMITTVEQAIHESSNAVTFVFKDTNLNKIQASIMKRMIALALKKCEGNKVQASTQLGISRQCLLRYMKKFKLALN